MSLVVTKDKPVTAVWLQVGEPVCDHITQECDHSYAVKQQWVQMHLCSDVSNVNGAPNRLYLENSVHI